MDEQVLSDIIDDETDPLDPTSMEKLLPYFDEIVRADEEFMDLLVQNLGGASIYWEQPWYQSHGKISRPPVFEYVDENDPYLTGSITQDEREIIERNWRKLIRKYKLPNKLISICRWKNVGLNFKSPQERARQFVIAYLARGLKRNLYQVLKHVTSHYTSHNKCERYSEIEEKVIEICLKHNPGGACRIASLTLGREPRSIYKKIQFLVKGSKPEKKRMKWNLPTASKFFNSLLKHSKLSLDELKYTKVDKSVWLSCQEDMKHNYLYLQQFWHGYLHVQLFVDCDVKLYGLKKRIFKKLRKSNYRIWTDIQWKEILKQFPDGMTPLFLYVMAHVVIRDYPNYRKVPLEQVLEYGFKKIKTNLKHRNKRLRRLVFKDGELTVRKDENT